jgi:2'-5' RNA ligase
VRLFVAVELPPEVRSAVGAVVEGLPAASGLRWESAERWHLTLAFLGAVDDSCVGDLRLRLQRGASRTDSFPLQLRGLGRFGRRVLFARVDGATPALRRLAERSAAAARRSGIAVQQERYRPHVTLARSRTGVDLRPLVDAGGHLLTPQWEVREIVLVESVVGTLPTYRTHDRWPLGDVDEG